MQVDKFRNVIGEIEIPAFAGMILKTCLNKKSDPRCRESL